ncbi:exo-beta-N-acetylmuramidase NamZ family protein [Chryseobacterium sp. A301]
MNFSLKIKTLLLTSLIFYAAIAGLSAQTSSKECFKAGADRPELYLPLLEGKSVAVVTNQTGLLEDGQHLVDYLVSQNIKIKHIFAPEHGFRGTADAGAVVKNGVDTKTGLSVLSLYGSNKKPSAAQLAGVDLILFDIQDVGVRFYTYISTLAYVLEAAAEQKIEVIVLDRPNPHDGYTDGPILESKFSSFVGLHPVPVVYGLTIGEYGKMTIEEGWLKNKVKPSYTLIPMLGYHKKERYPMRVKPSPNLPTDQAINLYPSLCFFEGTQVSVGRGTNLPFEVYGSPWTPSLPYSFTPKPMPGASDPFLNGKKSYGENLSLEPTDLRKLDLSYLLKAYQAYKNPNQNFFLKNLFFDKLAGTDALRKQIVEGKSESEIRESWEKGLISFEAIRSKYIIYPN